MKAIKVNLPRELKTAEIHTFADLHIGDVHCDYQGIKERIEAVMKKPNAYCILNGDIINNATKTSVSDCYAEKLSPMEQISRFIEIFEPIKDRIIAITSGNHENRTYNKEGVDITYLCAKQLGLEDRYSKTGAIIFVRVGDRPKKTHANQQICYTIYSIHGSGGGRKEGAKAIRLADMASVIDADIYIHSHTHLPMILKEDYVRVDVHNSTFQQVTKLFVNTSSMLNYGGYGEAYEFKPSSKDCPVIYLSGTSKTATAEL